MKPRDLVIWGASGHARVVAEAVGLLDEYRIIGFIDDSDPRPRKFGRASVLGGRATLLELRASGVSTAFIAVGDCRARLHLAQVAQESGFQFAIIRHPAATVSPEAEIGAGSFLAAGSVLGPSSTIESHVILNTLCGVDHHCAIGAGAHIGPGASIAGGVSVGRGSFLGVGCCSVDQATIGEFCVIGAGGVVVQDIPDHSLAVGVPARVIRKLHDSEENVD